MGGEPPLSSRLVRAVAPRSFEDVVLLLAAPEPRGPRSDLVRRILEIRRGRRKAPLAVPRLEAILTETEGVPLYQEQFVAILREMGGLSRSEAEQVFLSLREERGAEVARDRSLIVRRAVDRGFSVATAGRVFSVLLSLAPHAVRRGERLARARHLWEIAKRKDSDPLSFAVALLNEAIPRRERMRELARGFHREGSPFLPIHRNKSAFPFTVERAAVRTGLATIPGMTEELYALYAREKKEGGDFRSPTDILERMAGRDFPRNVLLELVRALQERERAGEKSPAQGAAGSRMRGAEVGVRGVRRGARPSSHGRRRQGGEGQRSFAFFEDSRDDGRAKAPARSQRKRGRP